MKAVKNVRMLRALEFDPNDPYYDYLKDEPEGIKAAPIATPPAAKVPEKPAVVAPVAAPVQ